MNRPPETVWVDVGGTRMTAWRSRGARLRRIAAAPTDPNRLPAFVRSVRAGTRDVLVVGLRGAWTAAEKNAWRRRLALRRADRVLSDIELAHELALGGGDGIVVNAGTGSIAYGRLGAAAARAGGLGPLIGDDGSAFWMGREYLRRIAAKREPFEKLRNVVKAANPVASVAAQARRVLTEAARNRVAAEIVSEAQRHLAGLAVEVRAALGGTDPLPVVLRGGLFENVPFRRGVEAELKRSGAPVYFRPVV